MGLLAHEEFQLENRQHEEIIFERKVAWDEKNKRGESIAETLAEFFSHIHFSEMGPSFLQNQVRASGHVPVEIVCDAVMERWDRSATDQSKRALVGDRPVKKRRKLRGCPVFYESSHPCANCTNEQWPVPFPDATKIKVEKHFDVYS